MTSNQLLDDLNERIWPKLQASLQEVAVAVRGAVPTVHYDIAKVRTKFAALHAYASFATARDLSIADEDVVISISCAGGSSADSPMECKSDILVQGAAGYLLDGPRAEIQIGGGTSAALRIIESWVEALNIFLTENRELIVREVVAARGRGGTYSY